ncbi:BlaI/MecI/CopY family transcriptional regulator [Mariniblastus fucicola]|uniref:Penicillinase repressor n=1 Tax=Mariniblastus fucicola TaxID=980251 RepID=A0A5B9PBR3_9BACT|nr:BlaI/MecI/CopY family transcriptional regulator [Mariniblastus fucicola]QEG20603.1 Penicillinase repressor [Mariniblastus fucicola]
MTSPLGSITGPQFEILQILWQSSESMTVAEIWQQVCEHREVSRTTTLNLVDRLEKRKWLKRARLDGVYRYQAAISETETREMLASEFVGKFFDGSPADFVLSFLGSQRVSKKDLGRMRQALEEKTTGRRKSRKSNRKG